MNNEKSEEERLAKERLVQIVDEQLKRGFGLLNRCAGSIGRFGDSAGNYTGYYTDSGSFRGTNYRR